MTDTLSTTDLEDMHEIRLGGGEYAIIGKYEGMFHLFSENDTRCIYEGEFDSYKEALAEARRWT